MESASVWGGEGIDPTIMEEMNSLVNLWNACVEEQNNSANVHSVHPLPVMSLFGQMLVFGEILAEEEFTQHMRFDSEEAKDDFTAEFMVANVSLFDKVFRFAQFCYKNGLLHANMTPCHCSTVTDKEIEEALKNA